MEGVSLFAGIGGFDKGAEDAGIETIAQVEKDEFCNRVLAKRFPGVKREGRIEDVSGAKYRGAAGVVFFGSPCQGLSVAGRRGGLADPRSGLFFEAARFIGECRPAFAVWENVAGAFSSHTGRDFAAVLRAMVELGARDVAWRVFNSRHAGVPQQRRRVYLVADFGGRRAGEVLYQPEACKGHPAPGEAQGASAAYGTPRGVARSLGAVGGGSDPGANKGTVVHAPEVAYCLADATGTRTGSGRDAQDTFVVYAMQDVRAEEKRQNGLGVRDDGVMYTLDGMSAHGVVYAYDETQVTSPGNYSNPQPEQSHPLAPGARPPLIIAPEVAAPLSPSLAAARGATAGKNGELLNNIIYAPDYIDTLGASADRVTGGAPLARAQGWRVRFMTPVEQERVQGFPSGWTCLCGAEADMWSCTCPDGPRNRALGNACTVNVTRWICERLARIA